ncbi:YybH family protein [Pseudonocardia asaccharolytica]|uniref:DUF4440 domain-containing protein n=1 Tax=Pseudonocardia asaccharolytica DSM 44247 = NBRC 16224 TaxID=1123024 RepID=A0A511D610_9PSEU|nr:SgcJ/EcaC family oxidoreductase [Pseudonocardia asaccharolytica]GEL20220.1 hypothetical protein PA7_40570 [Pseudonocardia asaccharolytica DSM 44247 = NBRC 16224]
MAYSREQLAEVHAAVVRSIEQKDAALFASLYTQDGALLMPDGQVVQGRTAIERVFSEWLDLGFVQQEVEVVEFTSDNLIAVEEGRAAGTFRDDAGETVHCSNYLIVHRLEADGVWRMHRDIWTSIGGSSSQGASY